MKTHTFLRATRFSRGLRKRLGSEQGSQLIELALVTPVLMILFTAAVDFGRAYFINMEVSSAAEAGSIYGIVHPTDLAGMQAAASLDAPDLTGLSTTASYGSECSDGSSAVAASGQAPTCGVEAVQYVEVDTKVQYQTILLYPGLQSFFTLNGKSRMRATF